jgi:preprotein translocase subunit SecA
MTDSQILSCLLALYTNHRHGRLLQVATGEGKSTIVSVIAIINGLKNKKVDIITSSPVLAERDAKEKRGLYKIFGLSCADNNDKSVYIKGAKDCYKNDIVYGEVAQFQFDSLRDEYSLLGTLANRKCEVAIVDEVDSMLIDDSSKIARLSSTIAGLDRLQPIYHYIWQRLMMIQQRFVDIDGKMYLLYGKISYEQDKIILEYADEKGELIQIPNLKDYIKSTKDISHIGQFIEV